MFGTSGIRGIIGREITPELALAVGRSIIENESELVIVSMDTRSSSPMLRDAIASGVLYAGGNIGKIGVAPTPTLALASQSNKAKGVMITASHNPIEYNGIKLFNNGTEISREEEEKITNKVKSNEAKPANWKTIGQEIPIYGSIENHMDKILEHIDVKLISSRKPKVIIDCGNGAGSVITPKLLSDAGCRVVGLNAEPSPNFARNLEPNEANLSRSLSIVSATKSDFGIAHDGDADRAVTMTNTGALLPFDVQLSLFCEDILSRRKGTIVTTVEASLLVKETVENSGGRLKTTKVGSLHVAEEMQKSKAIFGGEPCGEYIYPENFLVPDGIMTALKLVELYCRHGAFNHSKFRQYPIKRAKYQCENKQKAIQLIREELKSFEGDINTEDGIRIDTNDSWFLVRASGTEPIVRITCEHKSKEGLEKLFAKLESIIKKSIKVVK